jgi:hypothetical protein
MKRDPLVWLIIWYMVALLILIFSICGAVHAEDALNLSPGHNPTVEQDGKQIDICRVAAATAQNFLLLTSQAEERVLKGPPKGQGERAIEKWVDETRGMYAHVLRLTGELEIASSICLDLPIDPRRLDPEQQDSLERIRKNPKVAS